MMGLFVKPQWTAVYLILTTGTRAETECVAPGTCTPPSGYAYSRVQAVAPRHQWEVNGGYCGAMSIQAIAMSMGIWMSQATIRQAAPPGGGHGDPVNGYELLHTNMGAALDTLGFTYDEFNEVTSENYLPWMKRNLAKGAPVIWYIMCKGDGHNSYGLGPYDHIEPVFGLYSQKELTEDVRGDDILVHSSDYAPDGQENTGYYRRFDSLVDTVAMNGNCSNAQAPHGLNEAYPCINVNETFGFAMTGLQRGPTFPISLDVGFLNEPCTPCGDLPVPVTPTLTIPNIQQGQAYLLYRFDNGNTVVPDDVADYPEAADWVLAFIGGISTTSSTFRWTDSHPFPSSASIAYRCILDDRYYDLLAADAPSHDFPLLKWVPVNDPRVVVLRSPH